MLPQLAADGVLILTGPTCSGKTSLAIELAVRFGAEIVSADSRQIYRSMPIGTAAPDPAQRRRVAHHLVAFLDPDERYSAARFAADAMAAIAEAAERGKRTIVAGGTGFYIRALSGDVDLSGAQDAAVRARLAREERLHPPEVMHAWLAARDPLRAAQLSTGDRYRVVRALEISLASSGSPCERERPPSLREAAIPYVKVALEIETSILEGRIAERIDRMLRDGLLAEAELIGAAAIAADAVGYPQALSYLAGLSTREELRRSLVRATRRYAKRQRTWLQTEPDVTRARAEDVAEIVHARLGW
jgi:tRNA dimethylallyltransferase